MEQLCSTDITWYQILTGYLYANLVGSIIIWKVMKQMRKMIDYKTPKKLRWQPHITGIIERTLYIISLLFERPEFIIAWLAYKVAIGWKAWDKGVNKDNKETKYDDHKGRAMFSNHFNGSALSILYSFMGYMLIVCWSKMAVIYGCILIVMSLSLLGILWKHEKRLEGNRKK